MTTDSTHHMVSRTKEMHVRHWGYFTAIAAASLIFFVLSHLTTIKGDDIIYMFVSDSSPLVRVRTLTDLVQSMHSHYFSTNGRLANLFAQIFASFISKGVFNVANTLVFAAFLALVSRLISTERRAVYPTLTALFVLLFAPVPGETLLWMTGSCNYLWSMTASLAWIVLIMHDHRATSPAKTAALALLSLLAGCMNESVTAAALLGMGIFFLANRRQASPTVGIMLAAYAAGVAFVLASPGAWLRMENGSDMPKDISALQMLTARVTRILRQSQPIVLPYVAAAYGLWRVSRRNFRWRQLFAAPPPSLFIASAVVMLVFGLNAQRPYFAFATFSFIVVARAAAPPLPAHRIARTAVTATAAVLCIPVTISAFRSVSSAAHADAAMAAAIEAAPAECVLPAADAPQTSRFVMPNIYNSAHYHCYSEFYCALHGKRNVCFLPPDIHARFTSPRPLLHDAARLPYASSCPGLASGIYSLPGVEAAVVPVTQQLSSSGFATMHIANVKARCTSRWQQIKMYFYGSLSDHRNYYTYHFTHQGTTYLILPPVKPDITSIDVTVSTCGAERHITFSRTQQ